MVTVELVAWLAADGLGLVPATNLFRDNKPDTPDAIVVLEAYGGLPNEPVLGGTTINIEYPRVQALARGVKDDSDGPQTQLLAIVKSFAKIGDTILSGIRYGSVQAIQPPFKMRQDENQRFEWVVNFQIVKDFSPS